MHDGPAKQLTIDPVCTTTTLVLDIFLFKGYFASAGYYQLVHSLHLLMQTMLSIVSNITSFGRTTVFCVCSVKTVNGLLVSPKITKLIGKYFMPFVHSLVGCAELVFPNVLDFSIFFLTPAIYNELLNTRCHLDYENVKSEPCFCLEMSA